MPAALRLLTAATVVAVLAAAAVPAHPATLSAQESGEAREPIFRRFALKRQQPKFWQALFEVPVLLRPQSASDADIRKNFGLNYVASFRPGNRWYFSRSLGIAKMEWVPKDPAIGRVKVRTFDITMIVNRLTGSWLVTSFGLGLGVMDGLVRFNDERNFSERLEPFVPIQFGFGVRLGSTIQLGLKLSQFTFFRSDPAISTTRLLFGLGFNY